MDAFVVTPDDQVAGFVVLRPSADAKAGEIALLAVHPQHQRRGHARAVTESAIRRFRDQAIPLINVGTGGDPGRAPASARCTRLSASPVCPSSTTTWPVETSQRTLARGYRRHGLAETLLHDVPATGGLRTYDDYADAVMGRLTVTRELQLARLRGLGLRRLKITAQQITDTRLTPILNRAGLRWRLVPGDHAQLEVRC